MQTGISLITEERQRQIEVEGWTPEHDDEHFPDDLARAAACYAVGTCNLFNHDASSGKNYVWPWEAEWWKPTPKDRVRELTKAGALIAAEIDRLIRADNYDGAPYCSHCKAATDEFCDCGPISKDD